MKQKDLLEPLSKFGIHLSATTLAIIAVAVPVVIAGAVWLYKYLSKYLQERAAKKAATGPEVQTAAGQAAPKHEIEADELSRVWDQYMKRLPASYRRSVLNFEHFVVLAAPSADAAWLVETQTDSAYQSKVAGDAPTDTALPIYLGSGSIIQVLPSRYVADGSDACRKALEELWHPIYSKRSPTVVVAVDASWLLDATRDDLDDLAMSFRVRVDQLSAMRGRAVEVRLALTGLAALAGFTEIATFWEKQGISAKITLGPKESTRASLEAWELETRAQLPRALTTLSAQDYRSALALVRRSGALLSPLEIFLDKLFERRSMSKSPVKGGVYLCSAVKDTASPLRQAMERGPGPDPRRKHLLIAVGVASACLTYLGIAFVEQHAVWAPAADAQQDYEVSPQLVGKDAERERRHTINEFTIHHSGPLYRFPDFFGHARREMMTKLSLDLRDDLLIPQLREVAKKGIVDDDGMTLKWRRTLYFLALVHSYEADNLGIANDIDRYVAMTGLPEDVIEDYLSNTVVPYRDPVTFKLGYDEADPRDTQAYWARLPRAVATGMVDGVLRQDELAAMQTMATEMRRGLSRFDNDFFTLGIYWNINKATDFAGDRNAGTRTNLRDAYAPQLEELVLGTENAQLEWQVPKLRQLIALVLNARIVPETGPLLRDLVDALLLQQKGAAAAKQAPITLDLGEGESDKFSIDQDAWNELLVDSRGTALIDHFMAAPARESIFFTSTMDAELRDVVWNPLGTDTSIFRGRAVLRGRYTKVAFDSRVKQEVVRLSEALAAMHLALDSKSRLVGLVRDEVSRYAGPYRASAMAYLRSYDLYAPSAEKLRVALGVIASEKSTFDDFVNMLDENTSLFTEEKAKDAKGAGAKKDDAVAKVEPKKDDEAAKSDPVKKVDEANRDGTASTEYARRMLQPMADALRDFSSWHDAVGASSGAPELIKYKETAKQLLADLQAASQAPAPSADGSAPSLEKDLTPAGRAVLATLRGDKGSYDEIVQKWVAETQLTADQRAPFLAPFNQLTRVGAADIETIVQDVWATQMWPPVKEISTRFPFDRTAEKSALPQDLTALFHPQNGKFFSLFRAYIEPLSAIDHHPFRAMASVRDRVRMPADLYPTVNAVAALSARLWDDAGAPRRLDVKVATVPFDTGPNTRLVPTVVYLNAGDTAVFNFNQKPGASTLPLDWTRDENAQIGIQVTDVESKETSFPTPTVATGPYWRFFRLLTAARESAVKEPEGAWLYEWELRLRDGASEKVKGRLVVVSDPWRAFSLQRSAVAPRASR